MIRRWIPLTWSLAALLLAHTVGPAVARGGDWMFKPSYYSNSPLRGVPTGPDRFIRGPYYTPQYGSFVRYGHRHHHSYLGSGAGFGSGFGSGFGGWDHSYQHESWIQFGEQF